MEDAEKNEHKPKVTAALNDEIEIIELENRLGPGGGPIFPNWKCKPPQ